MMWPAQLCMKVTFTPAWLKPCSEQGFPLFWVSHLPTAMAAPDFAAASKTSEGNDMISLNCKIHLAVVF